MFLDRSPMRVSRVPAVRLCAAASVLMCTFAGAQSTPTIAPAPIAEMTPAERAQRDADKVFKWILIHADKPRKPVAAREDKREDKPAVAARAKPVARSAAAGSEPVAVPVAMTSSSTPATVPPPELPTPTAASPAAVLPPPIETALAPAASAATRVALPSLPALAAEEAQDEVLRPLVRAEPKFPPSLLRTLTKGQIQVRFTVLPDGSVAEPSVVTTTDSRLRPASLAAVAQWRFAPLRKAQTGVVDLVFDFE